MHGENPEDEQYGRQADHLGQRQRSEEPVILRPEELDGEPLDRQQADDNGGDDPRATLGRQQAATDPPDDERCADLIELGGVHCEKRVGGDVDRDVGAESRSHRAGGRRRQSDRKLHAPGQIGRLTVVVADQEAAHPADCVTECHGHRGGIQRRSQRQAAPADGQDDGQCTEDKTAVPDESRAGDQ